MGEEKRLPISPVSGSHRTSATNKMSPPKDSYWFAHAAEPIGKVRQVPKASPGEKDESLVQEQLSPSHKPYVDKQSDLHLEGVSPGEKMYVPPRAPTPNRLDSYWFAHSGIDLSSPTADQASDSGFSDGKESSPPSLQRDKKSYQKDQEQYFDGKQKQPKQLRTFTVQTEFEPENSYRQSKGEHYHDHVKYPVHEEKRSYIWDTKTESRETNLKQHFEQDAKLEARRNAQKNSLSFAFGNSVQQNFSENKSNIGSQPIYHGSEIIFPIIRHVDEHDVHSDKRNDMSSYNLIQKIDDCMSRSLIITSAARGRRKTDLIPVVPLNKNTFSRMPSPGNQAKRSVSMTRLDQLAQPRRHYVEARQEMGKNASSTVRKEPSQSPARPRSSLAATAEGTPEKNQAPKVTMRSKPRTRPRPISIAGTVPDQLPKAPAPLTKDQPKPSRRSEKKGPATSAKPPSTKVSSLAGSKESLSKKVPESVVLKEEKETEQRVLPESDSIPIQSESIAEEKSPEVQDDNVPESNKEDEMNTSFSKSRIISEEEAKAALQERRRLAREQAEREAELERIRQEEIRRQEEEQKRKEEEEQRRQEEEQLKLMAELQRQEEEKLRKAIEEKEKREEEERLKQEEENRLKAEKEEQERIAREEAERQRIELAERLKREEEERAERKRRVEQIMSRTRGRSANNQQADSSSEKSQCSNTPLETAAKLTASGHLPSNILSALSSIHGNSPNKEKTDDASDNNNVSKSQETEQNNHQSTVHNISNRETEIPQNFVSTEAVRSQGNNINNVTADYDQSVTVVINNVKESDKKACCDKPGNIDIHRQTNGYSDDNEMERSSNGISHERSDPSANATDVVKPVKPSPSEDTIDSNLEQVIKLDDSTTGQTPTQVDDNLLNKVEDVNSNTVPGTPIVAFEEVRQPQASITG